ncbi:MarR family transcriptional regulator [Isoptericola sp. b441]|uniref:MarR family transcriptional regulator n=1 Tax=Actinotalea lenta TaxID=3064654 RepID=A0ABT9DF62_9CELL|nr:MULTISPECIES: MarR family transcriptional regulator [unclassified Isoptericola]MDO8108463.1 MarR family transcriptional regulator [Isoptericola sp. b441]MDO8119882.1 MarR family transcriptional regulator [Isoptericola sp. b490]
MSDDAARLATAFGLLARQLRPVRGELSLGHFSTLASLERHGPQRIGDLARVERTSAPVMTRIVNVLERRELVARAVSEQDRRVVEVTITAAGLRLVEEVRAERADAVTLLLAGLTDSEREALAGAVEALEALAARATPDL